MPRVTRRTKRRRDQWGEDVAYHLFHGTCLECSIDDQLDHSDDVMKQAWEELKHQLLPQFIQENFGTRPWAWWRFESPGRRERIDGIQHPFDDRIRRKRIEKMPEHYWARRHACDLIFGVPRLTSTRDEATAQYESEAAYLLRHNLLTPAEKAELFS